MAVTVPKREQTHSRQQQRISNDEGVNFSGAVGVLVAEAEGAACSLRLSTEQI